MRTGIIYKATGPTGKVYIGKTVRGLGKRRTQHYSNALNANHAAYNTKFYRAIRKHGTITFEWDVIARASELILGDEESKFILLYDSYKNGYNSTLGGEGITGLKHTQKAKDKISKASSERNAGSGNPRYGVKLSEITKNKISASNSCKKQGETARRKKSKSLSGRPKSRNSRDAIAFSMGRPFLVFKDGDFVGRWVNQRGCAEDIGANRTGIRMCLCKKRQTHHGYVFVYEGESR